MPVSGLFLWKILAQVYWINKNKLDMYSDENKYISFLYLNYKKKLFACILGLLYKIGKTSPSIHYIFELYFCFDISSCKKVMEKLVCLLNLIQSVHNWSSYFMLILLFLKIDAIIPTTYLCKTWNGWKMQWDVTLHDQQTAEWQLEWGWPHRHDRVRGRQKNIRRYFLQIESEQQCGLTTSICLHHVI